MRTYRNSHNICIPKYTAIVSTSCHSIWTFYLDTEVNEGMYISHFSKGKNTYMHLTLIDTCRSNSSELSSIFYAMNFRHFLEMLEFNLWHFCKMSEIHYIKNARN